ncbi:hypothetical protein [Rhizobium sp. BR 314]|uniref:hypothetical protein n=1 Tax=Rhizobium sp. BR 314 TaxID=3040013 RepID=UPI0039BF91AF
MTTSSATRTSDTSIYLNENMLRQLEQPHEIFVSVPKILFRLVLYIIAGGALSTLLISMGKTNWAIGFAILFLAAAAVLLLQFRYVRQPIIILSKAGLHLRTRRFDKLMAWPTVIENDWIDTYRVIKTNSIISLRGGDPAKSHTVVATHLRMKRDEYLRLCSLYAAAASHSLPHG